MGNQWSQPEYSEDIIVMTADSSTHRHYGTSEMDISYRPYHAALIDSLSKYGAKVISFDLFTKKETAADSLLVSAIDLARSRGTSVVFGYNQLLENEPFVIESLRDKTYLGNVCLGKRLGHASVMPLVVKKGDMQLHSFALQSYAAFRDVEIQNVNFENHQIDLYKKGSTERVQYSFYERTKKRQQKCPAISVQDTALNLILDIIPYDRIKKQRESYIGFMEEDLSRFEGKLVFVGEGRGKQDDHWIYKGERVGVQLYADAVNTIMNKTAIRSLGDWGQLVIMMIMAIIGGFIKFRKPQLSKYWKFAHLAIAVVVYLGFTILLYMHDNILLNTMYHLVALFGAYWIVGKIEKKYL